MKKKSLNMLLIILMTLLFGFRADAKGLGNSRPPKPEKIEDQVPERPSNYHVWEEGKWKWARKEKSWEWKSGFWRMPTPYEFNGASGYYAGHGGYGPYGYSSYGYGFYPYSYGFGYSTRFVRPYAYYRCY